MRIIYYSTCLFLSILFFRYIFFIKICRFHFQFALCVIIFFLQSFQCICPRLSTMFFTCKNTKDWKNQIWISAGCFTMCHFSEKFEVLYNLLTELHKSTNPGFSRYLVPHLIKLISCFFILFYLLILQVYAMLNLEPDALEVDRHMQAQSHFFADF